MILISESGSTKCDWVLLDSLNTVPKRIRSKGFAIFLFKNIQHSCIKKILHEGMYRFLENHIAHYLKELETVPLHCLGSIAFYAKYFITTQLKKRGLNGASFVQRPIDNLIERTRKEHLIS